MNFYLGIVVGYIVNDWCEVGLVVGVYFDIGVKLYVVKLDVIEDVVVGIGLVDDKLVVSGNDVCFCLIGDVLLFICLVVEFILVGIIV